jgi:hypothetical protein
MRIVLVMAISLVALASTAQAADPAAGLSDAESRAASAEADIASRQAQLDAARANHAATSRRARPATAEARTARAKARALRSELQARQQQARAQISRLEATHREEVEDHDKQVAFGIGIGLAALIAAGIAIAWGWFRASAAVASLSQIDLGRALALCLGGGFLLVIVGAALSGVRGLLGAIGAMVFGLGFVLPTALLLGRHSAEIQRGRSEPILKRERLPSWVQRSAAALLLIFALIGVGSSLFAEQPAASAIPAEVEREADALTSDPGASQLAAAQTQAIVAQKKAVEPLAEQQAARAALRRVTRELRGAEDRLADAESDRRRFARRLATLVAREEREAAQAAAQAEREAEEILEEEESEAIPSGCDENYSGCVPPYPPDVDCAEVGETVTVYGSDPHGLDADGDLEGCE